MEVKNPKQVQKDERRSIGQSLVELTFIFPILLIMLSGLVEFGFLLNEYLVLISSTRNAARFASDRKYNQTDNETDCELTRDFFRQTGCVVSSELRQERPFVHLHDNGTPDSFEDDYLDVGRGDDVVISVFSILGGASSTVDKRFPSEQGWSYAENFPGYATRNHSSNFTSAEVESNLDTSAPSTGFLLVEVFYEYSHTMRLPWITAFVPDPIQIHVYTFMPLTSAEPTPTPDS